MAGYNVNRMTASHGSNTSISATALYPSSTNEETPNPPDSAVNFDADDLSNLSLSSDSEDDEPPEPPLPKDPIQGWPQLAMAMAKTPDFAAFSRFRDLNTKSLLYYQAQLAIYRDRLHRLEYEDAIKEGKLWAERADKLVETDSPQFQTVKDMRKVLKEYNKALLQYSKICALPEPESYDMRTLRQWLRNERGADMKVRGAHELPNTWGDLKVDAEDELGSLWRQFGRMMIGLIWQGTSRNDDLDLAVTKPQVKIDGFTRWVANDVIRFWKEFRKNQEAKKRKKEDKAADVEKTAPSTAGCFNRRHKTKKKKKAKAKKDQKNTWAPPDGLWVDKVKKEETLDSWGHKSALKVTSTISTVLACLLPVIAISVLSQLQGLRNLLLCLAAFAIVFAIGLIFLTQGTSSRTEIFTATAAFSAVMVVFISIPPAPVIMISPGSPIPSTSPSAVVSMLPN